MLKNLKSVRMAVLSAALIFGTATQLYAAHHEGARAAIEKGSAKWTAAFNAGDAAGVAALYTDDAQILPPNSGVLSGHEAIAATFQGYIDLGVNINLETKSVEDHGEMATEIGEATLLDGEGNTLDVNKYLVVWKLADGAWKMHLDMWSTNTPLPQPEAEEEAESEATE